MYAVYDIQRGYMCKDEDAVNEVGYDFEIDDFTVLFNNRDVAMISRGPGDFVVEITKCPSCERYVKPDTASSHTYTLDGSTYFKTYVTYCPRCLQVIETDARL